MGNVLSSDTIYAAAYLTDLGRQLLFDPITNNRFVPDGNGGTIDAFKIVYFSMSDPDYNYNVSSSKPFETGDIANISGKNDDCIKGTIVKREGGLISFNGYIGGIINMNHLPIESDPSFNLSTNNQVIINLNDIPVTPGI